MIKLDAFQMGHLDNFVSRFEFPDLAHHMELNLVNEGRECISILNDTTLICIAGVNYLRQGVGEVWLIPSVDVDNHKYGFYKAVRWLVDKYLLEYKKLHRLEMAVKADWEKGLKWAKSIGFSREGFMKKWCKDQQDHILYARVL